jgi:hypothetical protein
MPLPSTPFYLSAGVASLGLYLITRSVQNQGKRNPLQHVVPSPLKYLPQLSTEEVNKLPYPPDLFPGARDVDTPFGSIRVYEWGPESGRKVLLIHGISTPCMSLGSVAEKLVDSGCRVMMFGECFYILLSNLSRSLAIFIPLLNLYVFRTFVTYHTFEGQLCSGL